MTDPERLAVLRDLAILDTPADPDYDDIARLAAACCQSPIAAVNFVDDERHWTKAIVGVDDGQGASVPADLSLCAATVVTPAGLLSLSDTSGSGEWRSHPFVTGPPFLSFEVVTPDRFLTEAVGDLRRRRGTISGIEQRGSARVVSGHVPVAEMFGYGRSTVQHPGPSDPHRAVRPLRGSPGWPFLKECWATAAWPWASCGSSS